MMRTLASTVLCIFLVALVEVNSEAIRHRDEFLQGLNATESQVLPSRLEKDFPDGQEKVGRVDDDSGDFYDAEEHWIEGEREAETEEQLQDFYEPVPDSSNECEDVRAVLDEADRESLKRAAAGLWNRAKKVVNRVVESPAKYLTLIARFRKWQTEYKLIREDSLSWDKPLPTATDLMKAQFAKADHELMEALVGRESPKGKAESELENMDVIYMILRLTAQRLDTINSRYKNADTRDTTIQALMAPVDSDESKVRYEKASSRILRTTKKTAAALIQAELYILCKLMIYNELATIMATNPSAPSPESGPAGVITSLILSLGQAQEKVLVSYLSSIKFRTAWYVFDNPTVKRTISGCLLARKAVNVIGKKYLPTIV